jgi:hypothetical protein
VTSTLSLVNACVVIASDGGGVSTVGSSFEAVSRERRNQPPTTATTRTMSQGKDDIMLLFKVFMVDEYYFLT